MRGMLRSPLNPIYITQLEVDFKYSKLINDQGKFKIKEQNVPAKGYPFREKSTIFVFTNSDDK